MLKDSFLSIFMNTWFVCMGKSVKVACAEMSDQGIASTTNATFLMHVNNSR